jgi:hypothetical protein
MYKHLNQRPKVQKSFSRNLDYLARNNFSISTITFIWFETQIFWLFFLSLTHCFNIRAKMANINPTKFYHFSCLTIINRISWRTESAISKTSKSDSDANHQQSIKDEPFGRYGAELKELLLMIKNHNTLNLAKFSNQANICFVLKPLIVCTCS